MAVPMTISFIAIVSLVTRGRVRIMAVAVSVAVLIVAIFDAITFADVFVAAWFDNDHARLRTHHDDGRRARGRYDHVRHGDVREAVVDGDAE
jgi:hypothetical protein